MHFILKFKKSAVLKSFNLRHLWCRFSYLKDKIILLGYLFARKLKTVLCGYRISDVTVAKKPLGIWYKFPIRFRSVRIPSMSRSRTIYVSNHTRPHNPRAVPHFFSVQNLLRKQSAVHASSTYLTTISQSVHRSFPYISCPKSSAYISENGKRRGTLIICRFRILSQFPPSKRTAHSRIFSRFFCISAGYTHKLR